MKRCGILPVKLHKKLTLQAYIYIYADFVVNGNMYKYNVHVAIFSQCTAPKNDIRDELLRQV